MSEFKNVYECQSRNLKFLFSKIRAVETTNKEFAFYAMRLMKLIAEDGLALLGGQGQFWFDYYWVKTFTFAIENN